MSWDSQRKTIEKKKLEFLGLKEGALNTINLVYLWALAQIFSSFVKNNFFQIVILHILSGINKVLATEMFYKSHSTGKNFASL